MWKNTLVLGLIVALVVVIGLEVCPSCGEKCIFVDATCYTPDCGGPGNIDPQIGQKR